MRSMWMRNIDTQSGTCYFSEDVFCGRTYTICAVKRSYMPSKDSKNPGKDDANVVKFNAKDEKKPATPKKKKKITPTQIITYVILVLLAVVLIFGVFPSFGNSGTSTSIVFGTYDQTPIEFAYGNYFYRQYQNEAQKNTSGGDMAAYQVWRSAYESTVFHTALTHMADKAGIRVAEQTLNKAIIDSGAYDKDGKFDVQTYENASVESKNQIKKQYEENLPMQMVLEDIATVLSAPAEIDYIVEMGDSTRTFEYVVFDASGYPDDLARQYALANPALFTLIDISVITMNDEDAAKSLREKIVSGSVSFSDAAKENSLDTFAAEGGRAGVHYLYELQSNFTNAEEVNVLFSTKEGGVSQVFSTPAGYAVYRVEKAPFIPDLDDPLVLADVKTYIGARDTDVMAAYLEQQAGEFATKTAGAGDLSAAAEAAGLEVMQVEPTPANIGGSNYLSGFMYTDPAGYLNAVSQDVHALRNLYTLPVGSISDPIASNNAYVVAKVTSEGTTDSGMGDYLRLIYPYLSQSQIQQDLIQSVFTSDAFEDNFFTAFLENIMNVDTAN